MKPFTKAFKRGVTLDSMCRNDTDASKNVSFFQFLGHNIPINCSKLLGVRKRNEALAHSFTWRYHIYFYVLNGRSYNEKKLLTQNLDLDPEWLLICHIRSNTK